MSNEFSNSAVQGGACSYATLSHYNPSQTGTVPPIPKGNVSGHYIVPTYGAPGYNTLQHNSSAPSCSGFFNITNAYGKGASDCNTRYVRRLCQ